MQVKLKFQFRGNKVANFTGFFFDRILGKEQMSCRRSSDPATLSFPCLPPRFLIEASHQQQQHDHHRLLFFLLLLPLLPSLSGGGGEERAKKNGGNTLPCGY